MYASIFLIDDLKGLTHDPHGLTIYDWEGQSFLNLWIPFIAHTVTSTSIVSSGRLYWKNPYRKLQCGL